MYIFHDSKTADYFYIFFKEFESIWSLYLVFQQLRFIEYLSKHFSREFLNNLPKPVGHFLFSTTNKSHQPDYTFWISLKSYHSNLSNHITVAIKIFIRILIGALQTFLGNTWWIICEYLSQNQYVEKNLPDQGSFFIPMKRGYTHIGTLGDVSDPKNFKCK